MSKMQTHPTNALLRPCRVVVLSVVLSSFLALTPRCGSHQHDQIVDLGTTTGDLADAAELPAEVSDTLISDLSSWDAPADTMADANSELPGTVDAAHDDAGSDDAPVDLADLPGPGDWVDVATELHTDLQLPQDLPPDLPLCEPSGPTDPCDGVDNDCDGATDEDAQCDDLIACNGLESCVNGQCQGGVGVGTQCAVAPDECQQAGGDFAPAAGVPSQFITAGYALYDQNTWDQKSDLVQTVAQHSTVTPVTLDTLLDDLNRQGAKVNFMLNVECFHSGFTWNSGDQNAPHWYPQGLTGTATAYPDGTYNGRKVSLVSWYHKPEEDNATDDNKGVRVSFVETTGMNTFGYRHALLANPVEGELGADYAAIKIHAGGIAWFRNWLYVADAKNGLRLFDLDTILRVQTGNKEWMGLVTPSQGYHAHGYKYVIPQVTRFKLCPESCCARFSFVALDLTQEVPALTTGEYSKSTINGRIMRWELDPASGLPKTDDAGRLVPSAAFLPGVKKMQGALLHNGTLLISSSKPKTSFLPAPGTLYVGAAGQPLQERRFPYPPEDLHYSPFSDKLWCHTEHPGSRNVFAVKMADILQGCD